MANLKENAKVSTIQGHILLYCKSHYEVKDVTFIEGLKRIWAIKCGYAYDEKDNSSLSYIADELYTIIYQICDIDFIDFPTKIHKMLVISNDETPPIVKLIIYYRYILAFLPIANFTSKTNRTKAPIKLPTPKKKVFKRILKGKGVYSDYKLITE